MAHKHPLTSGQMREKQGGGWARGFDGLCLCSHVRVRMCVHMCESGRNTRCVAEKWGGRYVPEDNAVGQHATLEKTNVSQGSEFRRALVCFKEFSSLYSFLYDEVFFFFPCFIRSLGEVRAGNNWGIQIYAHVFLPFNENSHSLQETAEMKTSIQD